MNARTSRIFFAVQLPEPVQRCLHRWIEARKPELPFARWPHRQDYHITLKFIGEIPAQAAAKLQTGPLIRKAASPFDLQLDRLGTFGKPASPSVLWCGLRGDIPALHRLQAAVEDACVKLGYPAEERPYRPHITVARQYRGEGIWRVPPGASPGEACSEPFRVDRFFLYRTNSGVSPRYEPIAEFPLAFGGDSEP